MAALPNRILVPVDGSENSKRATEYALELAQKLGSSLVLSHVVEIPASSYRYRWIARDVIQVLEESGWKLLGGFEEMAKSKGVSLEAVLSIGDPVTQILLISKKKSCDCIIMGKRGLGRIQRMLIGSVSDRVIKLSDKPVIIVK